MRQITDQHFIEIYEKHMPDMYRFSYTYFLDKASAEKVVNDAFVKYRLSSLLSENKLKSWLIVTLKRFCLKGLKKRREEVDLYHDNVPYVESKTDSDPIIETLNHLPEIYSEVLRMYYYSGLSIKDISRTLHLSQEDVTKRLERGRREIGTIMEIDPIENELKNSAASIEMPKINPDDVLSLVKGKTEKAKKTLRYWLSVLVSGIVFVVVLSLEIVGIALDNTIETGFVSLYATDEDRSYFEWNLALRSTSLKENRKDIYVYYGHPDFKDEFDKQNLQYNEKEIITLKIERIVKEYKHSNSSVFKTVFKKQSTFYDFLLDKSYLCQWDNRRLNFNQYFVDTVSSEDLNDYSLGYIRYRVTLFNDKDECLGMTKSNEEPFDAPDFGISRNFTFHTKPFNRFRLSSEFKQLDENTNT